MLNINKLNKNLFDSEYVINKFVDYQNLYPPIHVIFLNGYIEKYNLNELEIIKLLLFNCYVYSDIGAIYIYENYGKISNYLLINNTVFSSARIKFKNLKKFNKFITYIEEKITIDWYNKLKNLINGEELQKEIIKIPEVGQFSSDLFIEFIEYTNYIGKGKIFLNLRARKTEMNWCLGKNETMGIALLYADFDWFFKLQEEYTKNGKFNLSEFEIQKLEYMKNYLMKLISKKYGYKPWGVFKGKLCSFKNFYSSKRYAGYHFGRQYKQIEQIGKIDVGFEKRMKKIREKIFKEYQNKETTIDEKRKFIFIKTGMLGIEVNGIKY